MSFLLDTNMISEWVKPRPNPGVIRWMEAVDEDRVFISVISLAELRYGIERMPRGKRQTQLDIWLRHDLMLRFEGRILPIDAEIADAWGKALSQSQSAGRLMSTMDAGLAASAEAHGLTLVTRNTADFAILKALVNPWKES